MPEPPSRHRLFTAALMRAEWSHEQLWLGYMGNGGAVSFIDLQAFLYGLMPLPAIEQDVLAITVNERLDDLYHAAQVPYLSNTPEDAPASEDSLSVIEDLQRTAREDHDP